MSLGRRDFLKLAGAQAGLLLAGAGLAEGAEPGPTRQRTAAGTRVSPDIVVVGAGAFGGWTAYYLARMGARVTLVDAYGPGNSRATSGDETRGVRTSYGDRPHGELWMRWASEAISRWTRFDDEWGREMKVRLFFPTGDLIMRVRPEPFTDRTKQLWEKVGVPHEVWTPDDLRSRYPVIAADDVTVVLHEPAAGVVRARRACEVVAEAFRQGGGAVMVGYALLGTRTGNRLDDVRFVSADPLRAGTFVFALGPWHPKMFPRVLGERIRTPLGHVHYIGTPPGDERFTFPHLPSYNFPGVTGWPALPPDNRGFRVRTGGERLLDPDTSPRAFDRRSESDKRVRDFVRLRFPLLRTAPLLETRACHYELSVSRNFIIDRHPTMENVWIAGGGSAEGFKFGPVVGEYIAKRILGEDGDPALAEAFSLTAATPGPQAPRRR